jgi:hypothetical protein
LPLLSVFNCLHTTQKSYLASIRNGNAKDNKEGKDAVGSSPSLHTTASAPIRSPYPYKPTIKLLRFKMNIHKQSTCQPLMITKDMYHALFNHTKIATRRTWGTAWHTAHCRAFQHNNLVRVWSRPDKGSLYGRLAGHVRYTHQFEQRLDQVTTCDVMLEGFPTWTVQEFLTRKFEGLALSTVVHVFMFMFYPLRG